MVEMPLPNQQREGRGDSWREAVLLQRTRRYFPKYLFPEQKPPVPDTVQTQDSPQDQLVHNQNATVNFEQVDK